MSPSTTSLSLIDRIRRKEEDGWRQLISLYGPLVHYWCRQADLAPDDSADVAQETFRAVVSGIDAFQKDETYGTFRGWLLVITRNKVRDHFRRQKLQPGAAGGTAAHQFLLEQADPESADSVDSIAPSPTRELFHRALDRIRAEFEDHTWQAFWKTGVEEQRAADVAAELGMKASAVYNAKSRVLKRLRAELGDREN